jgi:hypothetical protein
MINSRFLPSCYLFGISVFLALCANRTAIISQELPPLPDRSALSPRGFTEAQNPPAYIPSDMQHQGIHIVGTSSSSATATHLMTTATLSNGHQQLVIARLMPISLSKNSISASRPLRRSAATENTPSENRSDRSDRSDSNELDRDLAFRVIQDNREFSGQEFVEFVSDQIGSPTGQQSWRRVRVGIGFQSILDKVS